MIRLHGVLLVLLIAATAVRAVADRPPGPAAAPRTQLARIAVATKALDETLAREMLARLAAEADSPGARLRVAVVTAEITSLEEGRALLREVAPPTHETIAAIERAWDGDVVDGPARARVEKRHGWVGRLAFVIGKRDEDPERAAVLRSARRTALTATVGSLVTIALLIAGVVLFVLAMVRLRDGRIRSRVEVPARSARDVVWLETVNLFLAGLALLQELGHPVALFLAAVPLLWPFARGVRWAEWRDRVGLRGSLRDVPAGLVGHLAGLPLVFAMTFVTAWLAGPTGASHPAFDNAGEGTPWLLILVMAVVWAPLLEEVVFRGMLYGFLRPRFRALGSALLSGVAFAAVHPQGWAAIPVLGTIGLWLALLREWRGSLYAPMAAHAAHNGAIVAAIWLAVG